MIVAMQHPNATIYRRTADAFREGNTELLCDLVAADVVWHVPGDNRMAGEVRGLDALLDWFRLLREITEGTFTLEEHDVLASADHVIALSLMGAVRQNLAVSVEVVSVFHYRDGRQQERWLHPVDLAVWDRMLA